MAKQRQRPKRVLDVRPDTLDFRDRMYVATLYEVPTRIDLKEYRKWKVPVLDQGSEGACTGFGLATVANYLLRRRKIVPDPTPVSPRMLYEMAKRYDEWPGQDYEGSSARGGMKGWHKHGLCAEECWPYNGAKNDRRLTEERTSDALKRPLGAYFRVNHKDLVAMHAAMAEVGVLYATASVHQGWERLSDGGMIPLTDKMLGGHAFAIVAYDQSGFWIQNSWGEDWGVNGFAQITYDDWLANGTDVWVARLGAPVILEKAQSTAISHSAAAGKSAAYSYPDLRPHIISIGNDGMLNEGGNFGTSRDEVMTIFREDLLRVSRDWKKKRLLLYAHGGLVGEDTAVQRLADYRTALLSAEVYPISFIWHSDFWTTATNILKEALNRRRPEGFLDASKDFMLDRLDDALEPLARVLMGKTQWDEMKENAMAASESETGAARLAIELIDEMAKDSKLEIHIVGHSAGSIFHAPLVRLLTAKKGPITSGFLLGQNGHGIKVESCTLWAPACTIRLFKEAYMPAIRDGSIKRFALFTLTDETEQDDHCANIYHKSLLYLVSNAFEDEPRIPLFRDGEGILGMEKFVAEDKELRNLFKKANCHWILSPNTAPADSENCATARHHGDFDDDKPTLKATLARITGRTKAQGKIMINRSASSLRERRQGLVAEAVNRRP
jgi:hypothetical protein